MADIPAAPASRYRILNSIGEGGMGVVYRAADRLTGETVALKQVLLSKATDVTPSDTESQRLALSREFHTLAGLRHPHIVSVLDYGFDQQRQPFFTMTLLDHPQTIAEAAQGKSPVEQVQLLLDMLQALAYLHRRGVIHRDLKPANVLVDGDGIVKVVDFGLALAVRSPDEPENALVGTLPYMAPEVFVEAPPSVASDIYAVGVIACEIFAGKRPFESDIPAQLMMAIMSAEPDLSGLGDDIRPVVQKLLDKKPDNRYPDANAVIVALCQATGQPVPAESQAIRESFLQASEFVGREAELGQLVEALKGIGVVGTRHAVSLQATPSAKSWLIGGESGVGKSRLLDELRTRALVDGMLVLRGQGVAEGGLPYQLWREPLRRLVLSVELSDLEAGILKPLVPDIAALLGRDIADVPQLAGQAGAQRLALTIADVFKRYAQTGSTLLLLEDLQWTEESLEPLKTLNRFAPDIPLMIVGTYRDDERPKLPDDLPAMQTLKLPRLTDSAIVELSTSMLGEAGKQPEVVELLKRETEGNVFFMVEVVRALAEETGRLSDIGRKTLPQHVFAGGIQQIIRRRLSRVPGWARGLLKFAAVTGRELDSKILSVGTRYIVSAASGGEGLSQRLDSFLTACADAAVLEIRDNRWHFSHDKLRDMLLQDLEPDEGRDLNRQAAEAIEAVYPGDANYNEILMEHWRLAGDDEKELGYLLPVVARKVEITAEYARATQLAERGMTLMGEDDRRRATLLNQHSRIGVLQGDYDAAKEWAEQARQAAERHSDSKNITQSLINLGNTAYFQADYSMAVNSFQQSLEINRKNGDRAGMAANLNSLGAVAAEQSEFEVSQDYLQQSLALLQEVGDRRGIATNLNSLGNIAYFQGDFPTAQDYYQQGLTMVREIGDRSTIAKFLNNLGNVTSDQGEHEAAKSYYQQSLAIRREIGDQRGMATAFNNLGAVAKDQREYDLAKSYYQQSVVIRRDIGDRAGIGASLLNLGGIAAMQNDYPAAQDFFQQSLVVLREIGDRLGSAQCLNNLGFLLILQADPTAASVFREALTISREIDTLPTALESIAGLALVKLQAGRAVDAAELIGLIRHHPAAKAETLEGELGDAQRELEAALTPAELAAALERGKTLDLDTVIESLLAEQAS